MPVGYPHRHNLMWGMPITGRPWPSDLVFGFKNMANPMNFNMSFHTIKGMEVGAARQELAETALAGDIQYIFFLDEDVLVPPHSIPELVYKMDHHPEAAIITGVYCLKTTPAQPLLFRGNGNGAYWDWKAGEFFEISGCGMGCTMIRVDCLRDLKRPWFKTVYNYTPMLDGEFGLEAYTEDLWFCLAPNQIVYGDMLPIDRCEIGTKVLTHTGTLCDVEMPLSRNYEGEMIRIEPKYGAGFSVTPQHPVEVLDGDQRKFVEAGTIREGDKLIVPVHSTLINECRMDTLPMWPYIRGKHVEFKDAKFRYTRTHSNNSWFPLAVEVTNDLCALAGYWVAEGSCCGDSGFVQWTFNQTEMEYAADVKRLLLSCFGLKSLITHRGSALEVTCVSTALHDFFGNYFGVLSPERKVPEEIIMASLSRVSSFLRSYWRGDGSKTEDDNYGLVTTSRELAHALRFMLIRMKIYPSMIERHDEVYSSGCAYSVIPAAEFQDAWKDVIKLGRGAEGPRRRLKMPWLRLHDSEKAPPFFSVAVKGVSVSHYSGTVHNLTVNRDSTYNVNGFSVHNCKRVMDTGKWKIYADGSLLCRHYDMNTGESYGLPQDSKPVQHLMVPKGKKKILDIGSGPAHYTSNDGTVITADFDESAKPDYRCDLTKLPLANDDYDVVFSPALDTFDSDRTHLVLTEWSRVLKKGGEFILVVADFEYVSKKIIEGKADPKEFFKIGKKNAFTRETLKAALKDAGYEDIGPIPCDPAHIAYRSIKR